LHQAPPEAWSPLFRLSQLARRPLERFLHIQAASGILLMIAAAAALVWANSPWSASYAQFWQTVVGLRVGTFAFERTLEWVVNDGLMVIFFFVVGLEIRREVHHGELSEWRRAALPVAAAIGGMLAPAGLYLLLVGDPGARSGWGVPMATDIAFAVGVLTLLGKRVPAALRVLLLAVAVIDDLGAILVIAIFYSSEFSVSGVVTAAGGIGGIFLMQWLGVRTKLLYVVPSLVAWGGIYAAGVHPTIAGVIVGLITPVRAWLGTEGFQHVVRRKLDELSGEKASAKPTHEVAETLRDVSLAKREALSPAESLIASLHPWVAFVIMPIFALANAGVTLPSGSLDSGSLGVAVAVTVGLVAGKPLGILAASWLALRLRVGTLPIGVGYRHLVVLGVVAGIGFTMALFIAQLAFSDGGLLAASKLGILAASGCAAVFGLVLGRLLLSPEKVAGAALTADEAERSTQS
jgi:NhaA family Na+:H+ antiporter